MLVDFIKGPKRTFLKAGLVSLLTLSSVRVVGQDLYFIGSLIGYLIDAADGVTVGLSAGTGLGSAGVYGEGIRTVPRMHFRAGGYLKLHFDPCFVRLNGYYSRRGYGFNYSSVEQVGAGEMKISTVGRQSLEYIDLSMVIGLPIEERFEPMLGLGMAFNVGARYQFDATYTLTPTDGGPPEDFVQTETGSAWGGVDLVDFYFLAGMRFRATDKLAITGTFLGDYGGLNFGQASPTKQAQRNWGAYVCLEYDLFSSID